MANRSERLKTLIYKNIAEIVQMELKNKHLGFCVVNDVEVHNDHSIAKIYVTFLGSKYPEQNFEELQRVKGVVRKKLSQRLDVYKVPELIFILDEQSARLDALDAALKREKDELDKFNNDWFI